MASNDPIGRALMLATAGATEADRAALAISIP
jgi:hypothetical protein